MNNVFLLLKLCPNCKQSKTIEEFPLNRTRKNGVAGFCKPCNKAYSKKWRLENRERKRTVTRNGDLSRQYGLSIDAYISMKNGQQGCCKICLKPETQLRKDGTQKDLSVDHCHKSGKVRGLLCNMCNRALGYFKENSDNLIRAASYLKDNE